MMDYHKTEIYGDLKAVLPFLPEILPPYELTDDNWSLKALRKFVKEFEGSCDPERLVHIGKNLYMRMGEEKDYYYCGQKNQPRSIPEGSWIGGKRGKYRVGRIYDGEGNLKYIVSPKKTHF